MPASQGRGSDRISDFPFPSAFRPADAKPLSTAISRHKKGPTMTAGPKRRSAPHLLIESAQVRRRVVVAVAGAAAGAGHAIHVPQLMSEPTLCFFQHWP